jgi:hypothetical protein
MSTSNDYKELAARCTELASESSEPTVAEALRALASDYLARNRQAAPPNSKLNGRLCSWRRCQRGSEEQMFGAHEQFRHGGQSD